MKFFLLILLTASVFLGSLDARPAEDVVEHRTIVDEDDEVRTSAEDDEDGVYSFYGGLKGKLVHRKANSSSNVTAVMSDSVITDTAAAPSPVDSDFNRIQKAATQLVAIQEKAKHRGVFTDDDNKLYANSLYELGVAAQSLAYRQQNGEIKDFSHLLLQTGVVPSQPQMPTKPEDQFEGEVQDHQHQQQQQQQETSMSEENTSYIPSDDPYEEVVDAISVDAPRNNSPVASAKPVALSIAGEGGSAVARPTGVALAGREGLAIASPKATAFAGISPEEAAQYSITFPNSNYNKLVIKSGDGTSSLTGRSAASLARSPNENLSEKNQLPIRTFSGAGNLENHEETRKDSSTNSSSDVQKLFLMSNGRLAPTNANGQVLFYVF